jgi:hypothetical protein
MLYDPKWEQKADPLSLDSLIFWLEKQDASTQYDYTRSRTCLLTQWSGREFYSYEVERLFGGNGRYIAQGQPRDDGEADADLRWTFGAALERARSVQGMS